jgi:hypothetical protein
MRGFLFYIASSSSVRWFLRTALTNFMRFFTDGFVKNVRFLNSFRTPERSYFFLKRLIARSMDSFSLTTIPTKVFHLP